MRHQPVIFGLILLLAGLIAGSCGSLPPHGGRGLTWLELKDANTGRVIFAASLSLGEEIVLTWKNSLFGLMVSEVFTARGGRLELSRVTFADPSGAPPPEATAADLDDLYHTGGPFRVTGLSRPVSDLVMRVGEIGHPELRIGTIVLHLKKEVHFGGAVNLSARRPRPCMGPGMREMMAFLQNQV